MRDLRHIKMERGITGSKRPPRYNPEFVFPDKLSPYYQVLNSTAPEMMVGGAAGTAKTHHCVLKGHNWLACIPAVSVCLFGRSRSQ